MNIVIKQIRNCPVCNGTGRKVFSDTVCSVCDGSGEVSVDDL